MNKNCKDCIHLSLGVDCSLFLVQLNKLKGKLLFHPQCGGDFFRPVIEEPKPDIPSREEMTKAFEEYQANITKEDPAMALTAIVEKNEAPVAKVAEPAKKRGRPRKPKGNE